jgi:hypothetical protein
MEMCATAGPTRRHGGTTASTPPLGQCYRVDGRYLWLHRSGHGAPAVVFAPGGGAVGPAILQLLHDKLATSFAADLLSKFVKQDGTGRDQTGHSPNTQIRNDTLGFMEGPRGTNPIVLQNRPRLPESFRATD